MEHRNLEIVNTKILGIVNKLTLAFESWLNNQVVVDRDFFGNMRTKPIIAGPFQIEQAPKTGLKVWRLN
jgi:hypothetical protein